MLSLLLSEPDLNPIEHAQDLVRAGRTSDAITAFRHALAALEPDETDGQAQAYFGLALAQSLMGWTHAAEANYRRVLELKPDSGAAANNLGNVLIVQGAHREAQQCFRRALRLNHSDLHAHSNQLQAAQYTEGVRPSALLASHLAWDRVHAAPLKSTWRPHENRPAKGRPLKLGFVSPDLHHHAVGVLLVGALQALVDQDCHVACYSTNLVEDAVTTRLRAATDTWTDAALMDDTELAERIRSDQIDVLSDLSGHTSQNRLMVFARRPAPVQISWLGYVGTTGMEAMDYVLADWHHCPGGFEVNYREKVLRLPNSYVCFAPLEDAPGATDPVTTRPVIESGHVTFGCFNNAAKITPAVVRAWAEIVSAVPGSRLVLRSPGFNSPSARQRVYQWWTAAGGTARGGALDIRRGMGHTDLINAYAEIDIALDTFPYSGGLTTLEALWMGVPVVTVSGATFAGRHSTSHLRNAGLDELVAPRVAAYVDTAVALARCPRYLDGMSRGLRQRVAGSSLCDQTAFGASFMALMRWVFQRSEARRNS